MKDNTLTVNTDDIAVRPRNSILRSQKKESLRRNIETVLRVSVKVQKEDIYLHPHLDCWTYLIANSDDTRKFGCFGHFLRMSKRLFGH